MATAVFAAQAAYAQFQKDAPTNAFAGAEDGDSPSDGPDGGDFAQSQQLAVVRLGRGYALGTLLLVAIVITGTFIARGSVADISNGAAAVSSVCGLEVRSADALILLRSLQVHFIASLPVRARMRDAAVIDVWLHVSGLGSLGEPADLRALGRESVGSFVGARDGRRFPEPV